MYVPIVVVSYNNHFYVKNTVEQLLQIDPAFAEHIIVMDNNSSDKNTIDYLNELEKDIRIVRNSSNNGPWLTPHINADLYNSLPTKFILTDPDLEFNKNLHKDFIQIMSDLSDKYSAEKIGFALSITDYSQMYNGIYVPDTGHTIFEHESQFWLKRVEEPLCELYEAAIDTTFCLINKAYMYTETRFRIAGDFTARHLPWYRENQLLTLYEQYTLYKDAPISTISRMVNPYIHNNYLLVEKNKESFLIPKNEAAPNYAFWKDIYANWEWDTFNVFDRYLDKNKTFIDIGGWIGTTCIYGSRKSKNVFVVEADKYSAQDLLKNCKINCHNVTLVERAIFNKDDAILYFGRNKFNTTSKLNDSTSQIYDSSDTPDESVYPVKTISVRGLLTKYNVALESISLIKVDIEGGEEYILNDLLELKKQYPVPMYISFHYTWWKNPDLRRFPLTEEQIQHIMMYPFTSILF
jgi:FkbM family methyltransferase